MCHWCRALLVVSFVGAFATVAALFGCKTTSQAPEAPPSWAGANDRVVRLPRAELDRTAFINIPGGQTWVVPIEATGDEKYMINWKLVSGPGTISYLVRDTTGTIEFGLGGLTALERGRYTAGLRYFCFTNDTTPLKEARVAVGVLFYDRLPDEGAPVALPFSGSVTIEPAPAADRPKVVPVLMSKYLATNLGNTYVSPAFRLTPQQPFTVTMQSESPIGLRTPGRGGEHRQGAEAEIAQCLKYQKERADWSYTNGSYDIKQYDRLDGGKRISIVAIAKPTTADVDEPGLYQVRAFNLDETKPHRLEFSVKSP